jgi:hypothetical protein
MRKTICCGWDEFWEIAAGDATEAAVEAAVETEEAVEAILIAIKY